MKWCEFCGEMENKEKNSHSKTNQRKWNSEENLDNREKWEIVRPFPYIVVFVSFL